jgi:hypothetical protein
LSADIEALTTLLRALKARHYQFIAPTPATHARVMGRADKKVARDLRDVFGWSLPFARVLLDAKIFETLEAADLLEPEGDLFKSKVRVSSLDDGLFLHSAYPTTQQESVFFGPDSYRFASFLKTELPRFAGCEVLVDVGAGSGIGGIVGFKICQPGFLWLTDINEHARSFAMANVLFADVSGQVQFAQGSGLQPVAQTPSVIIANPPYIADPLHRAYRDGGNMHGAALSLDWARQAGERLARGGALLLYTGSAIVNGEDRFKAALTETLGDFDVSYREIDPDVFGEELEREGYADVERIAVVGVVAVKRK